MDVRSHAFVVKIWAEERDMLGAEPTWRGSVDDVHDGGRRYFSTLSELCDYLSRHSGMAIGSVVRGRTRNARRPDSVPRQGRNRTGDG